MNSSRQVIGWREWISLPAFGYWLLEAKVSTGITDSVLYSLNFQLFERAGESWVKFEIGSEHLTGSHITKYEAKVTRIKQVVESDGNRQYYPVITTYVVLGEDSVESDLVLVKPRERRFDIVLGQSFLSNRFIVDASLTFHKGIPMYNSLT